MGFTQLNKYRYRIEAVLAQRVPRDKDSHGKGLPWRLVKSRETQFSYEYALEVPIGFSKLDIEKQIDALYASCGAVVELTDRAGVVIVSVFPVDFPEAIPYHADMLNLTRGRDVVIGYDRRQTAVTHSFNEPHILIGGMTRYGKTDLIRWLLFQLISRYSSDKLHVYIVDMKGFSFMPFRGLPHVKKITRDLSASRDMLKQVYLEMRTRSDEVWHSGARKTDHFPWIILLIDEAAQLSPTLYKDRALKAIAGECENYCAQISCIGAEAKVSLWYCTQRPDSDVVNGQIKANMSRSVAFRCKTESNSKIILDRSGAEKLPANRPGRCIYSASTDVTLQVPFIGNDEQWNKALKPYRLEVLHDEKGGTTTKGIEPTIYDTDSVHRSGVEVFYVREPDQKGIGTVAAIGARKTYRRETPGSQQNESMATEQSRPGTEEYPEITDTF